MGAGLRAFTRFERVEYANGEEVPAEKFLAEVEGVVLVTQDGRSGGDAKEPILRQFLAALDGSKATTLQENRAVDGRRI